VEKVMGIFKYIFKLIIYLLKNEETKKRLWELLIKIIEYVRKQKEGQKTG
jgi:hypothetical protein